MRTINTEWLNSNSLRSYPFRENCSRLPTIGGATGAASLAIPNAAILDFTLTLERGPDGTASSSGGVEYPADVYLSKLIYSGDIIVMTIAERSATVIGTCTAVLNDHVYGNAYPIVTPQGYTTGWITLGDVRRSGLYAGNYDYSYDQTAFEPCTVRPSLSGVRSLAIGSDVMTVTGDTPVKLTGDITLLAGSNVGLRYDKGLNGIWIDAYPGAGYIEDCECETPQVNVVRTINGIPIEHVQIVGDDNGVNVSTDGNVIKITDANVVPCCGCEELEYLTDMLKLLETSTATLENYAVQLQSRMHEFIANYSLAYKHTDNGNDE